MKLEFLISTKSLIHNPGSSTFVLNYSVISKISLDILYSLLYTMHSLLYISRGKLKLENNLREFRFHHNEISQQDLANAVGVTRLTIHSIETGKFNPSTLLALKIANFFNAKLEDIFYLVEDEKDQ